jgi:hypothetical protein
MSDTSEEKSGGGGFGWFILGGLVGLAVGAYVASGPGRNQVDSLRSKTIELSGSQPVQKARQAAQRARVAVTDPDNPVGKAIQDGVAAAKRRREELEAAASRKIQAATNAEDGKQGSGSSS